MQTASDARRCWLVAINSITLDRLRDNLAFDYAIVGQRMRALQALARPPAGPRLLLTAAAALQRVRPAADLQPDPMLRPGDALGP